MAGNPIDVATFEQLQESTDAEFVAELLQAFLDDAPPLLRVLRNAQAVGDATAFRRAAHSLKSNANAFGAIEFSSLARALEETGLEALGDKVISALDNLEAAYASAASALQALCHG